MTRKGKTARVPSEPPPGHVEEITPSQRARILTRLHIEDADLSATAERVALELLGAAIDGRVSTSESALWRMIQRSKPGQTVDTLAYREIDFAVLTRLFDDWLRAGVLIGKRTASSGFPEEETIVCRFIAWPHVVTRPINAWFAIGERLPRDGWPVLAYFTYADGEIVQERWARCFYSHSDNTWYECATSDRGLRLVLPIVQKVTHWAEVELPTPKETP